MTAIYSSVIQVINDISRQKKMSDEELLNIDYLDKGLIDSFQIVEMITILEETFGIQFESDDLTSEEFRTLKGVSEIIKKKLKMKLK